MDPVERELIGNTDAQVWAKAFVETVKENPTIPRDEGTMIGWFANAIMAGYDEGRRLEKARGIEDVIREIAFQAAGVGSGAVMVLCPDAIMPSEEIEQRVNGILSEFGIKNK